ncbi:Lutropin-choriogonadotropic hormone receptor, partial [Armadillidium nasatum]
MFKEFYNFISTFRRLRSNRLLTELHPEAFADIKSLRILDLSETSIRTLPVIGLESLEELYLQDVTSLKVFPSVFAFRKLSKAFLTYHYHCCAFYYPEVHDPEEYRKQEEKMKEFQKKYFINNTTLPSLFATSEQLENTLENRSHTLNHDSHTASLWDSSLLPEASGSNFTYFRGEHELSEAFYPLERTSILKTEYEIKREENLAKRNEIDVTRIGCKIAGFLTVFSSELSVMTLTVITLERWYAIIYAIHLTKRLRLRAARKVMICAWLFSIIMAMLPLVGVSNYSKTSICLPMENQNILDLIYILSLLIINGLAFILICVSYGSMYISISKNNIATNNSDMTVAKRMGLLVLTDFACWAPIAFFGLTAVAGYPLIGVTQAKLLLVFFYPLNSCANPYLYAILTKQYRKDLFILLARYGFCTKRAAKYKGTFSSATYHPWQHTYGHSFSKVKDTRRISTLTQLTSDNESKTRKRVHSFENLNIKSLQISLPSRSVSPYLGSNRSIKVLDDPINTNYENRNLKFEAPNDSIESLYENTTKTELFLIEHPVQLSEKPKTKYSDGSPHPIKNWQTKVKCTPEAEILLKKFSPRNKNEVNDDDDIKKENTDETFEAVSKTDLSFRSHIHRLRHIHLIYI